MTKEDVLKQIASELGAMPIHDEYMEQVAKINSEKLRIGVMGGPKSGKTTVINSLAGTKFATSPFEAHECHTVAFGTGNTADDTAATTVETPWLKECNATLTEVSIDIDPDTANQLELCKIISRCDVCIYLMSATQAYNRTDALMLKMLHDTSIPTLAVLSRTDTLDDASEIFTYIANCLKGFPETALFDNRLPLFHPDAAAPLQQAAVALAKRATTDKTRGNFQNFFLGYAIARLFESCQGKIDECNEKIEKIKSNTEEKKNRLSNKASEWMNVETELHRRIAAITDRLRSLLEERKPEIMRILNHDVDAYGGSMKQFCEVELPYKFENILKTETQNASQAINQELVKTMQWLQLEVQQQFGCKIALTSSINPNSPSNINTPNIDVSDPNKLKIAVTAGRVATVLAAGLLLASASIPGIALGVATIAGFGAEYFMKRNSNNDRQLIKDKLPQIVEQAQSRTIVEFGEKIQAAANEIIDSLNTLKSEWMERETKAIEQEENIAIHNFEPTKWENVMARINQLSEIVLK